MNVIPKVELNFSETKSTPFNNIDPDDISNQCESEDSVKDEDISQNCVSGKKNMVNYLFVKVITSLMSCSSM